MNPWAFQNFPWPFQGPGQSSDPGFNININDPSSVFGRLGPPVWQGAPQIPPPPPPVPVWQGGPQIPSGQVFVCDPRTKYPAVTQEEIWRQSQSGSGPQGQDRWGASGQIKNPHPQPNWGIPSMPSGTKGFCPPVQKRQESNGNRAPNWCRPTMPSKKNNIQSRLSARVPPVQKEGRRKSKRLQCKANAPQFPSKKQKPQPKVQIQAPPVVTVTPYNPYDKPPRSEAHPIVSSSSDPQPNIQVFKQIFNEILQDRVMHPRNDSEVSTKMAELAYVWNCFIVYDRKLCLKHLLQAVIKPGGRMRTAEVVFWSFVKILRADPRCSRECLGDAGLKSQISLQFQMYIERSEKIEAFDSIVSLRRKLEALLPTFRFTEIDRIAHKQYSKEVWDREVFTARGTHIPFTKYSYPLTVKPDMVKYMAKTRKPSPPPIKRIIEIPSIFNKPVIQPQLPSFSTIINSTPSPPCRPAPARVPLPLRPLGSAEEELLTFTSSKKQTKKIHHEPEIISLCDDEPTENCVDYGHFNRDILFSPVPSDPEQDNIVQTDKSSAAFVMPPPLPIDDFLQSCREEAARIRKGTEPSTTTPSTDVACSTASYSGPLVYDLYVEHATQDPSTISLDQKSNSKYRSTYKDGGTVANVPVHSSAKSSKYKKQRLPGESAGKIWNPSAMPSKEHITPSQKPKSDTGDANGDEEPTGAQSSKIMHDIKRKLLKTQVQGDVPLVTVIGNTREILLPLLSFSDDDYVDQLVSSSFRSQSLETLDRKYYIRMVHEIDPRNGPKRCPK